MRVGVGDGVRVGGTSVFVGQGRRQSTLPPQEVPVEQQGQMPEQKFGGMQAGVTVGVFVGVLLGVAVHVGVRLGVRVGVAVGGLGVGVRVAVGRGVGGRTRLATQYAPCTV